MCHSDARLLAALTAFLCLGAAHGSAAGLLSPTEHRQLGQLVVQEPMEFFLAGGGPNACGPGCDRWIAAVGKIVPSSAKEFADFLAKAGRYDLPVFFHSPGGHLTAAVQIGSLLRRNRMSVGVGRSLPEHCGDRVVSRSQCHNAKMAGQEVKARLSTREGRCLSGCVHAFVGGSARTVAAGAWLGVHAMRQAPTAPKRPKNAARPVERIDIAEARERVSDYLVRLGVDPSLEEVASRTPSRRMYVLGRGEITRFGIETGPTFETPWVRTASAGKPPTLLKSVTEPVAGSKGEFRTTTLVLSCRDGNVALAYRRERSTNEVRFFPSVVRLVVDDREVGLRPGRQGAEYEDQTTVLAPQFLATLMAVPAVAVHDRWMVVDRAGATGREERWSRRELRLSTGGLARQLERLVASCRPLRQDALALRSVRN